MTACGADGAERLFVADGGYLENSGRHTVLALWEDLEPLIGEKTAGKGPTVVPIAVLVENHYRSAAALESGARVRELTGPPQADRAALVRSQPLEQALAADFGAAPRALKPGHAGSSLLPPGTQTYRPPWNGRPLRESDDSGGTSVIA